MDGSVSVSRCGRLSFVHEGNSKRDIQLLGLVDCGVSNVFKKSLGEFQGDDRFSPSTFQCAKHGYQ